MPTRSLKSPFSKESGAVLITGLIFMVVLTIIVISAMRSATLEERMSSNARNRQIALQSAEAVGRDAGELIMNSTTAPFLNYRGSAFTSAGTNGYYDETNLTAATPLWQLSATWTNAPTFANGSTLAGVPSQPQYYVERMGIPGSGVLNRTSPGCPKALFRVTSRGIGQDASTVFVQSMYRVKPLSCS
jgi:type IV pilus assembly protein PilX